MPPAMMRRMAYAGDVEDVPPQPPPTMTTTTTDPAATLSTTAVILSPSTSTSISTSIPSTEQIFGDEQPQQQRRKNETYEPQSVMISRTTRRARINSPSPPPPYTAQDGMLEISSSHATATATTSTPLRAIAFGNRYMAIETPNHFRTVAAPSLSPTYCTLDRSPNLGSSDTVAGESGASTAIIIPTMTTTKAAHSVMNSFEVSSPPNYIIWILFLFLAMGFMISGVLTCITFPPSESFPFLRLRWRRLRAWRGNVEGRGRYLAVESMGDDGSKVDGEEEEYVGEERYYPRHLDVSSPNMTSSAEPSPLLGGEQSILRKRKKKKNLKNLSVRTSTIGYKGLGICVRDSAEEVVVPCSSNAEMIGDNNPAAIRSGSSAARVQSTKAILVGEQQFDKRKGLVEEDEDEDRIARGGFLGRVEEGIENVAAFSSNLLHQKVRGAEEGLLFPVRNCERNGWVEV